MKNLNNFKHTTFLNNQIICINADCLEVMKEMENKSVFLILTDPPYIYNDYSKGNKGFDEKDSNIKRIKQISSGFDVEKVFSEFKRILKFMNMFCFCSTKQVSRILGYFDNYKKYQQNLLVWKKGGRPFGATFLHDVEFIAHIRETGSVFNGAYKSRVFEYLSIRKTEHPTEKPLNLFSKLVKYGSNENNLIFDCFAGSFTTAISCIKTNRKCICVERDKDYYKLGVERIKTFLKQKDLFI